MKKNHVFALILLFSSISCFGQELQVLSFNDLSQLVNKKDGKTRVVNFWATWCKPCIDELPAFMQAKKAAEYENIEFIFVSVDFQSQNQKVKNKIKELHLEGTLVQLNEPGNDWIDKMDTNWSGAIPYTMLILPNGKRVYHYDSFENYNDLKAFLDKNFLN